MGRGGRRDPSEYVYIKAEVFFDSERRDKRVRPIVGEVFPTHMRVECAQKIRDLPIGTIVRLKVAETDKEGSRKFLYSSYKWSHEVL